MSNIEYLLIVTNSLISLSLSSGLLHLKGGNKELIEDL